MTPQTRLSHWRLRVLAVVVPATLLTFGSIELVPEDRADLTPPPVPGASETRCLRTGTLDSLADLNEFATTVRGGGAFTGADVGADTELQDGRHLWVFGDTLRAEGFEGQRFVRNSMMVFSDTCAHVVLPADHGALIPDREDGVGYWPMSIATVHRTGYDLVGVTAQRVRGTDGEDSPDGVFAFENLGPAVAVFLVLRGQTPQLISQRDIGPDDPDTERPAWGAAAAVDSGWVYLYGTARPDETGVFGFSLQVARTRPEQVLEPARWRYWDGARWQVDPSRAQTLVPAQGGVSQTLSVFKKNGRWYALSKRDEFLGSELAVWTAERPTGPFTYSGKVADLPSDVDRGLLRYMPLAHPDLLPGKDSVIVSFSRNNTDLDKVLDNPFLYRPRFLRVDLPQ